VLFVTTHVREATEADLDAVRGDAVHSWETDSPDDRVEATVLAANEPGNAFYEERVWLGSECREPNIYD
jgi:hypothetical protein